MSTVECRTCGRSFEGDGRRRYCEKHTPKKRVRDRSVPRALHAIGPDDVPPALPRPKTIAEAVERGSTLDVLRLARERIARTLDEPNCPPREQASLSRRLIEMGKEIDAIEARSLEDDPVAKVEDGKFDAAAI